MAPMPPLPQEILPCCIAKLGKQIGCFDPTTGQVFGIHMETPTHSAQFWSWIETIPWDHDILLVSDDPGFKIAIIRNTQRLSVTDFVQDFQPGFPYECYPPMMMAFNAISLVRALKMVDNAKDTYDVQAQKN